MNSTHAHATEYFEKNHPDKVKSVDALIEKHKGNEQALLDRIAGLGT
jgi:hypothetical protein